MSREKAGRQSWISWCAALSVALALLITSQGCSVSETPPPAGEIAAPAAPEAQPVKEVADPVESRLEYRYSAINKPDPFRPFILARNTSEGQESPLQRFDLAQLNLTAVVWSVDNPKAMVEDPSGRSHVIQLGTDIGKNQGVVTKIVDQQVEIRETYVDYLGHETKKDVTLKIVKSDLYGEES